jgi:hypothetical protein
MVKNAICKAFYVEINSGIWTLPCWVGWGWWRLNGQTTELRGLGGH